MQSTGHGLQWTTWGLLVAACGGGSGGDGSATGSATEASATESTSAGTPATEASATGEPTGGGAPTGSSTSEPTGSPTSAPSTATGETTSTEGEGTSGSDTGDTTQPASASDTSTASDTGDTSEGTTGEPPVEKLCSADLHAIVDGMGQVIEACAADQGCADGACVPACASAAASKANFGCAFIVPTPPAYPPALPPCFAVFLANTVRPNHPRRPPTSRSAAIPGKRALWRGWARPTLAQRAPRRPGFWQRFGNAQFAPVAARTEAFDTARARPRRSRGADSAQPVTRPGSTASAGCKNLENASARAGPSAPVDHLAPALLEHLHCLNLPDTKTGQRSLPVPSQVITLLRHIHNHTGNRKDGLVICSRTGCKLSSLNRTWKNIRQAVGIPDVRIHDLRHSFASDALMGGVPLAIVGEMLGHRQPNTTKRYAHLANRVVREALKHTAGLIVAATTTARALPFEPLRDGQWAAIVTLVDAERRPQAQHTGGGTRRGRLPRGDRGCGRSGLRRGPGGRGKGG